MPPEFDPTTFFDTAKKLVAASSDESDLRTAVGRAYYAAFLLAREAVGMRYDSDKDIHNRVKEAVSWKKPNIGKKLEILFWLRKVADYEIVPRKDFHRNWQDNWQEAETYAELIIPVFQSWISNPPR